MGVVMFAIALMGVVRVCAMCTMIMVVSVVMRITVPMAVFMPVTMFVAVCVNMLVRMRRTVFMGVFVHVMMLMLVLVFMDDGLAVTMGVAMHAFLVVCAAAAGLTHGFVLLYSGLSGKCACVVVYICIKLCRNREKSRGGRKYFLMPVSDYNSSRYVIQDV